MTLVDATTLESETSNSNGNDVDLVASTIAIRDVIDDLDSELAILLSLDVVEDHRRRYPCDGWFLDAVVDRLQLRLQEVGPQSS